MKARIKASNDLWFEVDAETEEDLFNKPQGCKKFFSMNLAVSAAHPM